MNTLRVALAMSDGVAERIFPYPRLAGLGPELVLVSPTPLSSFEGPEAAAVLAQTDILITGWGCPVLTHDVLDKAPNLKFALHSAGSVKETRHLIDERRLELIRPGATFINTSRGALVDQDALVRRIQRGDLFAILDVTTPERLEPAHPLHDHPHVFLTPHVAGSLGVELERLGSTALDEARRAARGEPLRFALDPGAMARTA